MLKSKIESILLNFIVAAIAGFVFSILRIPLPWLLGPLTGAIIYNAMSDNRAYWPVSLRNLALIVMGYSMGRTMTIETARQFVGDLPAMLAATLLTLIFGVVVGYITCRKTGVSLASGVLGSMPGGLTQMLLLTEEIDDSDLAVVTLMQTARILAVIFLVPFVATYGLASSVPAGQLLPAAVTESGFVKALPAIIMAPVGAWLACRLKVPTPYLLGPIFATAAAVMIGSPAPAVPRGMLNAAQIFFGVFMGIGISLESLKQLGRVFPYAIGGALAMVAMSFTIAFGLTLFIPSTLLTTFLSTAPGGMAEMGITAVILHADITTVVSFQAFRLLSILLAIPPLLKWRFNR